MKNMYECTYLDFNNTLNEIGKIILNKLNEYICSNYSKYKPFDIKNIDKSKNEWVIHYRKKPKIGKAICSFYSTEGKLSIRFSFLSSMTHEYLLRQNEFSENFNKNVLKQLFCAVNKNCRCYGGNNVCPYRQYYWINNRLIMTCHYPWVIFNDIDENDISNVKQLIDLQMKHMVQDKKEIKGGNYMDINLERCKEVKSISYDKIILDIDLFQIKDYIKKPLQFEKYVELYNLIPMGENKGLWYYLSNNSICGINCEHDEYLNNNIPKGKYAVVKIIDPFTFSIIRVWNFICKWTIDNNVKINGLTLDNNEITACFLKFYKEDNKKYMDVCVPIKENTI